MFILTKSTLRILVLVFFIFIAAMPASAEKAEDNSTATHSLQDMVITSTKMEKNVENLIDPITVITEEEIKKGGYTDVSEILRNTPSIEFKKSGGPGQYSYTWMRGLPSSYFLVLIDGVKMNEAGGGVGNLFARLDPYLIEKIEILRGPQASLYGSSAMTGVISITTKGGVSGLKGTVGAEYGSLDWKKGYASLRGTSGNISYALNVPYIDSEGVQKYEEYKNFSPHAKIELDTELIDLTGSFFYSDFKNNSAQLEESYAPDTPETPWWGFEYPDPNQYNDNERYNLSLMAKHEINDMLGQKLSFGWNQYKHEAGDDDDGILGYYPAPVNNFSNPTDYSDLTVYQKGQLVPIHDDGTNQTYNNKETNRLIDYNLTLDTGVGDFGHNIFLLGIEYKEQEYEKWGKYGELDASADNTSFYLNEQMLLFNETLTLSGGIRYDEHEEYGGQTTYKVGTSYLFPTDTELYGNYGTAFKAPSFFNLYDPTNGNDDLDAETGNNYELGLRQHFMNRKVSLELVYFNIEVEDVITYKSNWPNPGGTFINADRLESDGLEFAFNWNITNSWRLKGNYSYTDSKTIENGESTRRVLVADNKWNLGLFYDYKRYHFGSNLYYTGPRLRWKGDKEMDEYYRVDVFGRINVTKSLDVYARIQNLFDEDIVEGLGYEEPGFYAICGFKYTFDFLK